MSKRLPIVLATSLRQIVTKTSQKLVTLKAKNVPLTALTFYLEFKY